MPFTIRNGSRPHRERLCSYFGLTSVIYDRWLELLVLLLLPVSDGVNSLERVIKRLFENRYVHVTVGDYRDMALDHVCLLSDRGFTTWEADGKVFFEFNLSSRASATFVFIELADAVPEQLPAAFRAAVLEGFRANVRVQRELNSAALLAAYNSRTATFSAEAVFSAHPSPWLG